jgi:arylsulfate sulfotransferase
VSKGLSIAVVVSLALGLLPGIAFAERGTDANLPSVTITLDPSLQGPQLLGTSITWTATVHDPPAGHTYDYQFAAALQGQNQIVRDFGVNNAFSWVPYTVEGTYVVTVVVRDTTQQPYIVFPPVSVQYVLKPRVTNPGDSAVNPTGHPLVALFSAGPCTVGHFLQVRFRPAGAQVSSITNAVPCSQNSANFLVGGMLPSTQYQMHWEEFAPGYGGSSGPDLAFTTGGLPAGFPATTRFTVNVLPSNHDAAFPVVLFQFLPTFGTPFVSWPIATDLSGNVLWYYPGQMLMVRTEPGGNFFSLSNPTLKEFDLAGDEILETNVNILNEQLAAKGYPILDSFNTHEARRLPNGNILVLGSRDVVSTDHQGGTQQDPVDIIGDMILVLDHNMQLLWAWDSFAHEDLDRLATLDDLCFHNSGGCPPFNQNFTQANDWLHTNSAQLTADGNIVLSQRSQDWVIKVNYANGHGDGTVLWRMGPFGDFKIANPPQQTCGDPNVFPWFTHQHDAAFQFELNAVKTLTVFDDGNLRRKQCGGVGNSRGMIFNVSESTRTVFIETSADLGQYSLALGSAQLLFSPPNNYYASFGNGLLNLPGAAAQATEVDLAGNIVYQLQGSQWSYRSYRMRDLYTPTLP